MKIATVRRGFKKTLILVFVVLVVGCQSRPPSDQHTIEHIECDIQDATQINCCIEKSPNCSPTPVDVSRAMLPNIISSYDRNIPAIERRFDLMAEKIPANIFFLSLVKDTPYNVNVHPEVGGTISLQLKKVTIPEVLETVRNVYGYDYRRSSRTIEIFPAMIQTRAFKINYLDVNRGGESQITVTAGGLKSGTTSTGTVSGLGTTTVDAAGAQQNNAKIKTKSKSDFWVELKETVEGIVGNGTGRKVSVSPMASSLVVQAMPEELRKVAEYLRNAQLILNRQVILEAKVIEVELNDSFQSGINWELLSGRVRATEFGGDVIQNGIVPGDDFPVLTNDLIPPIPISPGRGGPNNSILPTYDSGKAVGSFGGVFSLAMNLQNFAAFIELLSAQGKVHVMSSPRVSTLHNQKALIKIGKDQFFITNVSTTVTSTGTTSNTTPNVTFDSFFSGIALDVTPAINSCDEVTLHIHPMVSNVKNQQTTFVIAGQTTSVPLAASTIRESDSVVRAKSGQTVIIGGLMQDSTQRLKEGLPILKDLPVIGNVFGHTVEKTKKSELIILLRPVVTADNVWTDAVSDSCDRIQNLNTRCGNER